MQDPKPRDWAGSQGWKEFVQRAHAPDAAREAHPRLHRRPLRGGMAARGRSPHPVKALDSDYETLVGRWGSIVGECFGPPFVNPRLRPAPNPPPLESHPDFRRRRLIFRPESVKIVQAKWTDESIPDHLTERDLEFRVYTRQSTARHPRRRTAAAARRRRGRPGCRRSRRSRAGRRTRSRRSGRRPASRRGRGRAAIEAVEQRRSRCPGRRSVGIDRDGAHLGEVLPHHVHRTAADDLAVELARRGTPARPRTA